jgi:hypothetical protein
MGNRKVEKTGSFVAVDADGNRRNVNIYTTFTEHRPLSGRATWVDGSVSYELDNGNHVNVLSDGTLEDFVTGQKLHKA